MSRPASSTQSRVDACVQGQCSIAERPRGQRRPGLGLRAERLSQSRPFHISKTPCARNRQTPCIGTTSASLTTVLRCGQRHERNWPRPLASRRTFPGRRTRNGPWNCCVSAERWRSRVSSGRRNPPARPEGGANRIAYLVNESVPQLGDNGVAHTPSADWVTARDNRHDTHRPSAVTRPQYGPCHCRPALAATTGSGSARST